MTPEDGFKYKTYKSLFKKLKKAKVTYYLKLLRKYKTDLGKQTPQVMKEITGKQKIKLSFLYQEIKVDKTIIQNPQDIVKKTKNFLLLLDSNWQKKIPNSEKTF